MSARRRVTRVVTVGRSATGVTHPKLHEIVHADLWNYACFFCLGITSAGMNEAVENGGLPHPVFADRAAHSAAAVDVSESDPDDCRDGDA
jgi:hypothetical protein